MYLTPHQSFDALREALAEYLETAYRIAHPDVFAERGAMLRQVGTIAQIPFIEATPAFATGQLLQTLEQQNPDVVPAGLSALVQHGVPVDRFALYTHQQAALLAAFSTAPHLLVATGTGSGKTESFLLPILADILRDAQAWAAPRHPATPGYYNTQTQHWEHNRRHEVRPAGLRAIVLYPMNALVNDQLSRLRRILARGNSPEWQRKHLNGNVIHFGMYTGLSQPTGSWQDGWRRTKFQDYLRELETEWGTLSDDLRATGFWPRPNSPEMLGRWDMQAAPPDILVTNYSMLEYMLVRPIEDPIFEQTRRFLATTPNARLTLVLDEAHTYTGAKGTEVAYLVRRLKERLGINPGSDQFRAIATTASVPEVTGADTTLRQFTSDLFGEDSEQFTLIRATSTQPTAPARPSEHLQVAFARFYEHFNLQTPRPAINTLATDLGVSLPAATLPDTVALHQVLEQDPAVAWVRWRTARNATPLDIIASECWRENTSVAQAEVATAGVLAAGSFARPSDFADTPPLLSMRIHGFFRGIPGLWACMNPECHEAPAAFRNPTRSRPVGKLYTEARAWCGCGARVLELFSCRHCGLLFLGGIPDSHQGSLWHWSDDLSGERQDLKTYRIFGVEPPDKAATPTHRSTITTLSVTNVDPYARPVYETDPHRENDQEISPFPTRCPRCQQYRVFGVDGREVIEPLRTKGPQSFSAVLEEAFRIQPRNSIGRAPNYGRKALLFSDSRQEAAILAANMRGNHHDDLFRQLAYFLLHACSVCNGSGTIEDYVFPDDADAPTFVSTQCVACGGMGRAAAPNAIDYTVLRERALNLVLTRRIDLTEGHVEQFFTQWDAGDPTAREAAEHHFDAMARRDMGEDEFALEPLGLAMWRFPLPDVIPSLTPFTEAEARLFLQSVIRLLATENILLPPSPHKPWQWGELVPSYHRNILMWAEKRGEDRGRAIIPYNLGTYRKLGRYVRAVGVALVAQGRLNHTEGWLLQLRRDLWRALQTIKVFDIAGPRIGDHFPLGIRIDKLELHPLGKQVHRCEACAYIMHDALLQVCVRCGQSTQPIPTDQVRNYYRRAGHYALPNAPYDDPFPLRVNEHTAQIATAEARNEERWFQDLFLPDQHPDDHRVDVLSVTTTMEMGIDIGSLLCVGLRNVAPTVANYQQRAGRAGRRGSALATVLTFAQARSHDQYYFARPPEIVSQPPRVPALYINNDVIARRHVRALVLQAFFYAHGPRGGGLFQAWGTTGDYQSHGLDAQLRAWLVTNHTLLMTRLKAITDSALWSTIATWLDVLPNEVATLVAKVDERTDMLELLPKEGLLPKYAFPLDVVSLHMPSATMNGNESSDAMQRDLRLAIAEYAPGAEVVRQANGATYKYRSMGIYDQFNKNIERSEIYAPTGRICECHTCQSVQTVMVDAELPDMCWVCGSFELNITPYVRPKGFTVDGGLPEGGRVRYQRDGRERSGEASPVRLLAGASPLTTGGKRLPNVPALATSVIVGKLFVANYGPERRAFAICPVCGRWVDQDATSQHRYPADVPPHYGQRGPRAGWSCSCRHALHNRVALGHEFYSELLLVAVELPASLEASYLEASGRAIWYSFGTLVQNAAARVLQIDPGEMKVGIRPLRRPDGRLQAELFLYDDVPGGAGYARAVQANLRDILDKALDLGRTCSNPDCQGACYQCMLEYRNQTLHPLLDRALGTAVIEFLLSGTIPSVNTEQLASYGKIVSEYARTGYAVEEGRSVAGVTLPCVLRHLTTGERSGLWVIHPLSARPNDTERRLVMASSGIRPVVHTTFDLDRRPFWVVNQW
jgi:ATP-dependent helicase YprA (DUF1998 family)